MALAEEFNAELVEIAKHYFNRHQQYWLDKGVQSAQELLQIKSFQNCIMPNNALRNYAKKIDPSKMPKIINIPPEYLQDGTF